jgi:hypothetical protein
LAIPVLNRVLKKNFQRMQKRIREKKLYRSPVYIAELESSKTILLRGVYHSQEARMDGLLRLFGRSTMLHNVTTKCMVKVTDPVSTPRAVMKCPLSNYGQKDRICQTEDVAHICRVSSEREGSCSPA